MIASALSKCCKDSSPFLKPYNCGLCCDIVTLLNHNVVEVFSSSEAYEIDRKWEASKGDR